MGIKETLEYIHSVKWQGVKPGLERTRELLRAVGNPENSLKFVHIAGTNGKGSTAACITSVLQKAGFKTGLYTSPYIMCFNERMQVNGAFITDEELERFVGEVRPYADSMKDSPTEFELITVLAFKYFLYHECDIVVLEVGMGGELDSTNVIGTPEVAVITSIGYDHVKELGPTIADIARAKAGIIKEGGDVVTYGGEREVEDVFERVSAQRGARLHRADFSRIKYQELSLSGNRFLLEPYGEITLPLLGVYQPKNAALAVAALEILRNKGYELTVRDIVSGLESVRWPGRFEVLGHEPVFILDGAHNPQGIEAAADSLRNHFEDRKVVFAVGVMADKDADSMFSHIAPLAQAFVAMKPDHIRAMDVKTLSEILSGFGLPVESCDSVREGVAMAIKMAGKSGIVCALGSLYFSGDIRDAYDEVVVGHQ